MIAYFAHDLADATVAKRVRMFLVAGGALRVLGFKRTEGTQTELEGAPAVCLGHTEDAKLAARAMSVLRALARVVVWGPRLRGARLIVARNIEMLLLAWAGKLLFARRATLVYELLDIHRVMLGEGRASRLMRAVEGFLMRRAQAVIISSPAFEAHYLDVFHAGHPPTVLVENKVLLLGDAADLPSPVAVLPAAAQEPKARPWRIGWFGAIRCRESLLLLLDMARAHPGLFEVTIRGRIAYAAIPDFDALIKDVPGFSYLGPYRNPGDLASIYAAVDFVWAIDFYEKGLNSSWLLPNRLYEGCLFGAVPLAIGSVETGAWIGRRQLGVVLQGEDLAQEIPALLHAMTDPRYRELVARVRGADKRLFFCDPLESQRLVTGLMGAAA